MRIDSQKPTPNLGIYVHVPFCARHCEFCAFFEQAPLRHDIDRYLDGAVRELATLNLPRRADTVFWGGGTPGLLLPRDMEKLGCATIDAAGGKPSEWTVEMTPATMRPERLHMLRDMGVTRISMGVQSFDENILRALGRIHTVKQVYDAIDAARAAGFDNLNLDMMFALPGQSFEQWETDLKRAIAAGPEHISTYCLSFEEDTPLWLRLQRGQTHKRSADEEADFYENTWAILEEAGLAQYEVSNFARTGRECVHNLNTWRMQEWVGVGPSASSQWHMRRYTNIPSLDEWLAGLNSGKPALKDVVALDENTLATDCIVFGLRMVRGVNFDELRVQYPAYDWVHATEWAKCLVDEDLALFDGRILRLTSKGRLVADEVALSIM